jgi:hypothetical protein
MSGSRLARRGQRIWNPGLDAPTHRDLFFLPHTEASDTGRRRALGSSKGHDQVGDIAKQEAQQLSPHDEFWRLETLSDPKQFGHHIDDRFYGECQEEDKYLRGIEERPHHGPEKRGAASNESQQRDERPGHRLTG